MQVAATFAESTDALKGLEGWIASEWLKVATERLGGVIESE